MIIPRTTEELIEALRDIQDHLAPLYGYIRTSYVLIYIFRHTILEGKDTAIISIKTANIGLGKSKAGYLPSEAQKAVKFRALDEKGYINVVSLS